MPREAFEIMGFTHARLYKKENLWTVDLKGNWGLLTVMPRVVHTTTGPVARFTFTTWDAAHSFLFN